MKKILTGVVVAVLALASCKAPQQVAYYQDTLNKDTLLNVVPIRPITVLEGDKVMIVVHTSNPQLSALLNMPVTGTRIGMTSAQNQYTQASVPYTVAQDGTIDFPEIGVIKIKGLTREQVARTIKQKLVDGNICRDAVVIVEMDNMYINVLGEVNRPGRYQITKDVITIEDAIGMAGDLNIQGKRENIEVVRFTPEGKRTYCIDMTNMQQMLQSPAYYLQQNDVVYVEPNGYRKRQTTVNGNNALSTSFWISVASLLTSVAVLFRR